jgi:hypothetical protein
MPSDVSSWDDTAKAAVLEFVSRATSGPGAVPEPERIVVFDSDRRLRTEKPMPVELVFILQR